MTAAPEDAEEFKERIEGLVNRYEAQYLPKRKRKLTTQQIRDMDEGANLLWLVCGSLTDVHSQFEWQFC